MKRLLAMIISALGLWCVSSAANVCEEANDHWRHECGADMGPHAPEIGDGVALCLNQNFVREFRQNQMVRENCIPVRAAWPGGIIALCSRGTPGCVQR